MNMLVNLDMVKNQILNAVFQNLTTAPTSPVQGQYYYNTTDKELKVYNGTTWDPVGSLSGEDIIALINSATGVIDIDNLPSGVGTAVTNTHTHSNKSTLDLITEAFTTALKTKLDGISAGAQVNTVTSVAGKTGAVTLTKSDVSLSNVTNDAQVKKIASSAVGNIPTWSATSGDSLGPGYTVENTTLFGGSGSIPRSDVVKAYVDSMLAANDAMIFKGTLGTGGTITALPTTYNAGWTYKVITAGTYAGQVCEINDLIIAVVDRTGSGNLNSDWTVVQTNLDGVVIGPASSIHATFPLFNGTTGKLLQDSGMTPSMFATQEHTHSTYDRASSPLTGAKVISDVTISDGIFVGMGTRDLTPADIGASRKVVGTVGGGTSVTVTHNLNSRDLVVTLRRTASPYDMVMADIEFTDLNTLTVKFAVAPSAGEYTITIIG